MTRSSAMSRFARVFGLILPLIASATGAWAQSFPSWGAISPIVPPYVPPPTIQTIQPSAAWTGVAGSVTAGQPVAMTPSTAVPLGQQAIVNVTNDGGLVGLDVADTSKMSDGEDWLVGGTGIADGFSKIQVVSPTHVRLCPVLSGSLGSYACSGSTYASGWTAGGTIGFPQKAIGLLDTPPFVFIQNAGTTFCVGAASGTRAWIDHVTFYMEGNVVTVTQQTLSPDHGTQGWCVHPQSRTTANGTALDGDALLQADIVPANGFDRVLSATLHLNTNGTLPRPVRYVDCVNGSDSVGNGLTTGTAWQSFEKGFNASPSGAIVEVLAPIATVTITPGAHTLVSWPGNNLQPGGTVAFPSGPLPSPMVAGGVYYVMPDNFVAGQSFEITDQIIGLNTPTERDPLGNVVTAPLATTGGALSVTAAGTTCIDPDTKLSAFSNARSITITPMVAHSVTETRTGRNVATTGVILNPYVNRAIYDDITFDMSKIGYLQNSGSPAGLLLAQNSRLIDPNGPNPPFAYNQNDAGVNGPMDQSKTTVYALTESTLSYQATAGVRLMRNVTGWGSYDIYVVGAYGGRSTNGMGVFNFDAHKHGNLYARQTSGMPTVSAAGTFDGTHTKITIANPGTYNHTGVISNDTLVIYSTSSVGGQPFPISAIDNANNVITVTGDASAALVGDRVLFGNQAHSDNFQITGQQQSSTAPCPADPPLENIYMQRYHSRHDYATDSYQGLLGQSGTCALPSGLTATVSGKTVTFSSPYYMQPYEVVWFNTSASNTMVQSGRVDASFNGGVGGTVSSVPLVARMSGNVPDGTTLSPVPTNGSVGWAHGLTGKDIAFVDSYMDANGLCQPQNGHVNWVMADTTWIGCNWQMRDQMSGTAVGQGFYLESFAWFDSIMHMYSADSKPFPPGDAMDNSVVTGLSSAPEGQNMSALTSLSFTATGSPIGLGKTLRSAPLDPWDMYNQPRTIGSAVGAVN